MSLAHIAPLPVTPYPLLGDQCDGPPFRIFLTAENPDLLGMDLRDQQAFQQYLDRTYGERYCWGIAGYLEYREPLLRHLQQMRRNRRYYHLGVDVIAPLGTELFASLDAVVEQSGDDAGQGNYGGYTLLRHEGPFQTFYSLYGHIDTRALPTVGTSLRRGQKFGRIGDFGCNGGWFHHVHVQLLTAEGLRRGYVSRGYCTEAELPEMPFLCPSPIALIIRH